MGLNIIGKDLGLGKKIGQFSVAKRLHETWSLKGTISSFFYRKMVVSTQKE